MQLLLSELFLLFYSGSLPFYLHDPLGLMLVGMVGARNLFEELILTTGTRDDRNLHPGSYGCEPSALLLNITLY